MLSMRPSGLVARLAGVLLLAAATSTSCGDAPPSSPSRSPNPDPKPPPPRARAISLEGPGRIAIGETVQFKAIADLADGSRQDVTRQAQWSTEWLPALGQLPVVSIDEPGVITGRTGGEIQVIATFQGQARSQRVTVLAKGTYRLSGHVSDASGAVSITDVLVEVMSGAGSGSSTLTNYFGSYWLFGVGGDTQLRFSKEGFQPLLRRITVVDDQLVTVSLDTLRPYADVSGAYTVRIAAAAECGRGFGSQKVPDDAAVRTYGASIRQAGAALRMTLNLPDQSIDIEGRLEPARITWYIPWPTDYYAPYLFVDRISDSRTLVVAGTVWASLSRTQIEGELAGIFGVSDASGEGTSCDSNNHQFVMSR